MLPPEDMKGFTYFGALCLGMTTVIPKNNCICTDLLKEHIFLL